jgi:hypothetical protein
MQKEVSNPRLRLFLPYHPMRDTYATLALRRKRAYLAGEIVQAERQLADKYRTLKTLDATIQLFAPTTNPELIPAISPRRRDLFFREGEQMRLCLSALRETEQPLPAFLVGYLGGAGDGGDTAWGFIDRSRNTQLALRPSPCLL